MLTHINTIFHLGRSNWLKIIILLIITLTLLKKDFSFHIQMNGAEKKSAPTPALQRKKSPPKSPILSDKDEIAVSEVLSFNPFAEKEKLSAEAIFWKMDKKKHLDFIRRFRKVAKAEGRKFNLPPAIILANGLLLSAAGSSKIAVDGNNFFAIPCTADWQGKTQQIDGICYRVYDRAWTSFRDHSLYLTTNIEWGDTLPDEQDYQGWAKLLELVGFVSNRQSLVKIIEEYDLDE